jgi:hypothetical protein
MSRISHRGRSLVNWTGARAEEFVDGLRRRAPIGRLAFPGKLRRYGPARPDGDVQARSHHLQNPFRQLHLRQFPRRHAHWNQNALPAGSAARIRSLGDDLSV